VRCVALLSGGLDSILAIRLMQQQGIEVEALNFKTLFTCCQDQSARAAHDLGVRLTILGHDDDYLDLIARPRFGYGRGANPCIDCRIYMFRRAADFMADVGAAFVVSGELVGQRPKSQKRRDLSLIALHSGLDDLLLRPLSARCLPPTRPEREGWVDRQALGSFTGRSRKGLIELAHRLGIRSIPTPSTGCALTEVPFSRKVFDLVQLEASPTRWDFELLKVGRHYRFDAATKVVVGRRESYNERLRGMFQRADAPASALITPESFLGPTSLIVGVVSEPALDFAGGLTLRHTNPDALPLAGQPTVVVNNRQGQIRRPILHNAASASAVNVAEQRMEPGRRTQAASTDGRR